MCTERCDVVPSFVKFSSTGGSRYRSVPAMPALTLIVARGHEYSAIASPPFVLKLPSDPARLPCKPRRASPEVTTSMTPPSLRPYSAG